MADKIVFGCAETGTLSGSTITLSGSVVSGILAAQLFSDALSDGDTVTVTVADASDASVFAVYSSVPYTASGTTLDLSSGTLIDSAGTLGSSVNVLGLLPAEPKAYGLGGISGIVPSWTDANTVAWASGVAHVDGALLEYTGDNTGNLTSGDPGLSATGVWNHYLYDNSGTPTIELSQTDCQWDSTNGYWRKGTDPSRRLIGWHIVSDASGSNEIIPFTASESGNLLEMTWPLERNSSGDPQATTLLSPVFHATATTFTAFSLSGCVPVAVNKVSLNVVPRGSADGDDVTVGVSALDLDSWYTSASYPAAGAEITVRTQFGAASGNMYPGRSTLLLAEAQTAYYCYLVQAGTGNGCDVRCHGGSMYR